MLGINQSENIIPRELLRPEKIAGTRSMSAMMGNITLGNEYKQFKPNTDANPFPYWFGPPFTGQMGALDKLPMIVISAAPYPENITPWVGLIGRGGLKETIR